MLDRRNFLKKAAIVTATVVAADQLDLLERLTHTRKFFPGADFGYRMYLDVGGDTWIYDRDTQSFRFKKYADEFIITREMIEDDVYNQYMPKAMVKGLAESVAKHLVSVSGGPKRLLL
jgi:hypothetical protein